MGKEFGKYLKQKRTEKGISLTGFAKRIGCSLTFYRDMELGNRNPIIDLKRLNLIASFLKLNKDEEGKLFNLAGKERNVAPPDIVEYINDREYVSKIIRLARDLGADENDWKRFEKSIKKYHK